MRKLISRGFKGASPPAAPPCHSRWLSYVLAVTLFHPAWAPGQSLQVGQISNTANYVVATSGANDCVWQNVVPLVTNQQGRVLYRTNSYTELATGLNHLFNDQWVPSSENIQITAGGGVATNGQHQVSFAANINVSNAVQITTPDSLLMNTHIMGMSYYDTATGSNVLFAELQDSIGQVVANNQVVYPNAFSDCDADIRYTYTRAGIEQDIVVQQQLATPDAFGLNPDTTWLQVWTEFADPPTPAIETSLDGADELLDFGAMQMERGKAFIMGSETNSVPVNKSWRVVQGRTFLVEQVQFDAIASQLQNLPPFSSGSGSSNGTGVQQIRYRGFPKYLPPAPKLAKRADERLKLAKSRTPEKGLVLDYLLQSSSSNVTFQADTTYFVTGAINLTGTTTIEGGTVVKYTNYTGGSGPTVNLLGPVKCLTGPYRMAVFTAMDDNTVGQMISGSTGIPTNYYANYAIDDQYSGGSVTLQYLRISFAIYGCQFSSTTTNWIKHSQFLNDAYGVYAGGGTVNVQNVLFSKIGYVIFGIGSTVNAVNVTADNAGTFFDDVFTATLTLTNSLLASVSSLGSPFTSMFCQTNTSDLGMFQTAGAGNFYLVVGSPYRDVGTTNIDPALLSDLQSLTTYPPVIFNTNTYAANTTLYPQAQRDYDTPDLGYHYAPIDYLGTYVVTNATLMLTNGVALGQTNANMIWLQDGGRLVSQGTPNQHNYMAFYTLVQEQPTNLFGSNPSAAGSSPIYINHATQTNNPTIFIRFTSICSPNSVDFTFGSGTDYAMVNLFTMKDSEVYAAGGQWSMTPASTNTIILGNDLFQYSQLFYVGGGTVSAYNNLFTGIDSYFEFDNGTLQNNAFDVCNQGVYLAGTLSNTAYLNMNTNNIGQPILSHDIVTNLTWVTGPLGSFYQATSSPLLNKGSTTADQLGLYHYTVTTNEVTETNSTVDIGYHYVALGANGLPLDSNGDGIPDYLEDSNGNGIYNITDLANWLGTANPDTNGIVALQVYTPLR